MSSILTNNSAMVALQTLKSVNANLSQTQNEISTGKSVSSAKDNAAVWSISKVMESDVKGFKTISESLSLGQSTATVGREAAETVTDLLTEIKGKIVSAQESNVDRDKIQTDIEALTDQIKSVTGAAQFNGLNLVKGTEDVEVLASLDRSGDGSVKASNITVERQDLTSSAGKFGSTAITGGALTSLMSVNSSASATSTDEAGLNAKITFAEGGGTGFEDGDTFAMTIGGSSFNLTLDGTEDADAIVATLVGEINARDIEGITATDDGSGGLVISNTNAFEDVDITTSASFSDSGTGQITELNGTTGLTQANGTVDQRAETVDFSTTAKVEEGAGFQIAVAGASFQYVAGKGEDMGDVARGLKTAIDSNSPDGVTTSIQQDETTGQYSLAVDYDDPNGTSTTSIALSASSGGEASGGLFGLDNLDVTTDKGASSALDNVETLIQNSIDAAASFGSAQGRIETQSDFVGKLTDSLKSGIGSMVDADMEETSAKLQALQVQQQLSTQALSIANQSPQSILSLFR